MKRLLLAAGFLCTAFAAQDRAISSPDRVASLLITPAIDLNGTVIAFVLRANFQSIDAKPSGEVTALPLGSVEVDLMKSPGSVVVEGVQYEYREVADLLMAVAVREWKLAHPDPLPQRRRALRVR